MSNHSARDHKNFNCSEEHESNYVANQYGENSDEVKDFLKKECQDGDINYSTHAEVYKLIKDKLGFNKSK